MSYLLRVTLIALALLTTVSCSSKRMLTPTARCTPRFMLTGRRCNRRS